MIDINMAEDSGASPFVEDVQINDPSELALQASYKVCQETHKLLHIPVRACGSEGAKGMSYRRASIRTKWLPCMGIYNSEHKLL